MIVGWRGSEEERVIQNLSAGTSEINYIYRKLLIFPVDKTHLKLSHEYLETNYELFTKWKIKISMCEAMLIAEFSVGNDITYANLPQFIGNILIK